MTAAILLGLIGAFCIMFGLAMTTDDYVKESTKRWGRVLFVVGVIHVAPLLITLWSRFFLGGGNG